MSYRDTVLEFAKKMAEKPIVVFDTETTGLKPLENDIIEFSAVKAKWNGTGFDILSEEDFFINPGYPIPEEITNITGIDDETVKDGLTPEAGAKRVAEYFGLSPILAGYNSVSFDEPFVNSLLSKTGLPFVSPDLHLDVLKMAKEKMPKPHKLINMAQAAGVADKYTFHRSIDDAKATLDVLAMLLPMYLEAPAENKVAVEITGISRWQKYSFDRIYISNKQNIPAFYDVVRKEWVAEGCVDAVEQAAYSFAGVSSEDEFVKKYTS